MDAKKIPLKLYRALYGNEKVEVVGREGVKRKARGENLRGTESHEQVLLATWLTKKGILFYHCPNGGQRNRLEAYHLKQQGVKAGIPDICVPMARSSYHGLYIELKRKSGGILSDAQRYWIERLNKEGYLAVVANGFDEAKKMIESYLMMETGQDGNGLYGTLT